MMNNKAVGTQFEREMCSMLTESGWWVHFMDPNRSGAQPFDIIAVRNGRALAADCKTCVAKNFTIKRLEDNQIMAFDLWIAKGNSAPKIFVKHDGEVYVIDYMLLKWAKSLNIKAQPKYSETLIGISRRGSYGNFDQGI